MSDNFSGRQLYDQNNNKLNQQEKILDEMLVVTDNAKMKNVEIQEEVKKQDVLIADMKGGMNRVDSRMRRINDKIGVLLQNQSFYRLYSLIILELLILIVLIM